MSSLSDKQIKDAEQDWQECSSAYGIDLHKGPEEALAKVAKMKPHEARGLLNTRASLFQLETRRGSLKQVGSGLKRWHGFATLVLEYPEQATLPPRSEADACTLLSLFVNDGTATNYLGYVRWA